MSGGRSDSLRDGRGVSLRPAFSWEGVPDAENVRDTSAKTRGAELGYRDCLQVVDSRILSGGRKCGTERYVKPPLAAFASAGLMDHHLRFLPLHDRVREIGQRRPHGGRRGGDAGVRSAGRDPDGDSVGGG